MMLPFYFVLAQCFHKFRLGVEPSVIFFQGLCFPVLFLVSCFSVRLFAMWLGPSHPVDLGHGWPVTPVAAWLLNSKCITGTFSTPLEPNVLHIWP